MRVRPLLREWTGGGSTVRGSPFGYRFALTLTALTPTTSFDVSSPTGHREGGTDRRRGEKNSSLGGAASSARFRPYLLSSMAAYFTWMRRALIFVVVGISLLRMEGSAEANRVHVWLVNTQAMISACLDASPFASPFADRLPLLPPTPPPPSSPCMQSPCLASTPWCPSPPASSRSSHGQMRA